MKKKEIQRYALKGANFALTGLLAILGISCSGENGMNEYGTPIATYSIKGKVMNKQGTGIPNINISVASNIYESTYETIEEAKSNTVTDTNGNFSKTFSSFPVNKIRVYATDNDGAANGSYTKDSTNISISKEDFKDGSGWNSGKVSKDNVVITMTEEKK